MSGPVFRNQFYLVRFQSAYERRLLRPMRAKQAQAQNKIGHEKRVQMSEKFNFLSFHTIHLFAQRPAGRVDSLDKGERSTALPLTK